MISLRHSGSKTLTDSESEPSEVRGQPSFFWTFFEFAGLLESAQRLDDGVEEVEKDEHAILIVVQDAIAGAIAFAADVVETFEQRREPVEVLQAAHVLLLDFGRRRRR